MTELRVIDGGVTNSRLTDRNVRDEHPAGLDTVRLRYRATPEQTFDVFRSRPGWGSAQRGEMRRAENGVVVGVFPDGMAYVEGRLASLLGEPSDYALRPSAQLVDADELWRETLGVDVPAEVGRADVTAELAFDDGAEGLALLAALSSTDVPWLKIGTEGRKRDELETVYARTARGRSVVFRVYDKGIEQGTHPAGERIRFERQRRYRKDRARTVAEWRAASLPGWFAGRELGKLWTRSDGFTVCDRGAAGQVLAEKARAGALTWQAAERLVGYVTLRGEGMNDRTQRRRESELRDVGIAIETRELGRRDVDVPGYLAQVVELVARAA